MSRRRLVAWFAIGVAVGVFLVWTQARATGGVAGMLQVGGTSNLRPLIEEQLGPIPLADGFGHDGQISFAIALDPDGDVVAPLLDDAGYRYRRILYPALASLVGLVEGRALLWSMVSIAVLSFGLATAALADVGASLGTRPWVVAGVLANPGAWLAVRLVTPDALALGIGVGAVALWLRGRSGWAITALALAALAKDQYLLVAGGIALALLLERRVKRAVAHAAIPILPLAAWSAVLTTWFGGGFDPRGNLAFPFAGVVDAVPTWGASTADLAYSILTVLFIVAAAVGLVRARDTRLHALGWPWICLAVVSSTWVWDFGNNSLRAFAFVGIIAALAWSVSSHSQAPETVAD